MVTVAFFNANPLAVQVSVNNAEAFSIAGTSGPGWVPQRPASGGPTWGSAGPGVLGPGDNVVTISVAGAIHPITLQVVLPGNVEWNSVQFYFFLNAYLDSAWVVLNGGQYVAGHLAIAAMARTAL